MPWTVRRQISQSHQPIAPISQCCRIVKHALLPNLPTLMHEVRVQNQIFAISNAMEIIVLKNGRKGKKNQCYHYER